MAIKLNPLSGQFDITDSKWRYSTTSILAFKSSAITTLQGNTGGLSIYGGTATSDGLNVYGTSATFNSDNTSRINLKERVSFNESFQIDHDGGAILKVSEFNVFSVLGTQTLEVNTTTTTNRVLYAAPTLTYDRSQAFSTVTTFDGRALIKGTGSGTDSATDWRTFFAFSTYSPLLSTAVNNTTNLFGGYSAAPTAVIFTGSHASATVGVQNMYGYVSTGTSGAQTTVTNYHGFWSKTPALSGSGAITNVYSVDVESVTVGTNGYGARIGAHNSGNLWLNYNADPTGVAGGIIFGSSRDTTLHRSAASTLRLANFTDVGGAGGTLQIGGYYTGSAYRNGLIFSAGTDTSYIGSISLLRDGSTVGAISSSSSTVVTLTATGHNFSSTTALIYLGGSLALERSTTTLRLGEGFTSGILLRGNSSTAPLTFGTSADVNLFRNAADVLRTNDKLLVDLELEVDGALNHDGTTVGFYGVAPTTRSSAYTPTNVTTDRSYDANATTLDEVADVLGTLIADLQLTGIIG